MRSPLLALALWTAFAAGAPAQSTPQITFAFPQIAVGKSGGQEYVTTVIFTNTSTTAARAVMLLFRSDGTPLQVTMKIVGNSDPPFQANNLSFTLDASTSGVLELSSSGAITAGWALVSTSAAVGGNDVKLGGTAVFVLRDGSDKLLGSAGVGGSFFIKNFFTPTLLRNPDLNTGVAVANANDAATTVSFELYDVSGKRIKTATRSLPRLGHLAEFVDQIFGVSAGDDTDVGMMKISAGSTVAGVVVQFTGTNLTTFPVISDTPPPSPPLGEVVPAEAEPRAPSSGRLVVTSAPLEAPDVSALLRQVAARAR